MKQYHDDILTPKNLWKGDLILVYTLKQHIGKFKKQGFGPCKVEEVSSRGAIKLSMLDIETMSNWVSERRLIKYQLPLIIEMLERINEAKNKEGEIELKKVEAQAEAWEHIRKIKQRRAMIATIMPPKDQEKTLHPYIPIQVENHRTKGSSFGGFRILLQYCEL